MYITKEEFDALREKYSTLLIVNSDVVDALNFVQELLEAEADALKEREPTATASIDRLNKAAYEVFDICGQVDNEDFYSAPEKDMKVYKLSIDVGGDKELIRFIQAEDKKSAHHKASLEYGSYRGSVILGEHTPEEARWKGAGMGDSCCSTCNETVSGQPDICPGCGSIMDKYEIN